MGGTDSVTGGTTGGELGAGGTSGLPHAIFNYIIGHATNVFNSNSKSN